MLPTTPYANCVFEQPWWLDIVAPNHWGESIVKDGDRIIARLPYVMHKKKICMPPFTQTLGPWIDNEYRCVECGNVQFRKQKEIIISLLNQIPKHDSFNMTFDSANAYILPYRWSGFSLEPTFSYRLQTIDDLQAVYDRFGKTVVKNIKSARNKVIIVQSDDPQELISLLEVTFKNQGRTYRGNKDLITNIITFSLNNNTGYLLKAVDTDSNIHSIAFFVYDQNVFYYLFGGSDIRFRSSGSQSLILWEGIQLAAKKSKMFDFEGSMVEGIENFFRQFGGYQAVNYRVKRQSLIADLVDTFKPRIKRILGYKI